MAESADVALKGCRGGLVTCMIMLIWLHSAEMVSDVAVLINFASNIFCAAIVEFPCCYLLAVRRDC
jgi:hypothetical protein